MLPKKGVPSFPLFIIYYWGLGIINTDRLPGPDNKRSQNHKGDGLTANHPPGQKSREFELYREEYIFLVWHVVKGRAHYPTGIRETRHFLYSLLLSLIRLGEKRG